MGFLKKVARTLFTQVRERGLLSTLLMNASHCIALLRGMFYKLIYNKRIQGYLFSMQGNSSIELFDKQSKAHIGKFVFMRKNVSIRVDSGGQLYIGEKSFINDNCTINCALRISIGRSTKIAPNVCINDHDHNYKNTQDGHLIKSEVVVGDHVWIGANVVILRGAVIGDHAVIAAGSIVKGTVPPHTLFLNQRENRLISFAEQADDQALVAAMKGSH